MRHGVAVATDIAVLPPKHGDIQDAPTLHETVARMRARLAGIVPDLEIPHKAELAFEINQLKRQRNAVILGHNYMEPALYHSVPDYVGDSLELSRISARTEADIIVFCGVQFMAETAKILSPEKTVLIPAENAGCSLAEGITAEDVRALKALYPGAPVVTYVNTYAEVKAESDYCCTSGNAAAVVRHVLDEGHDRVVFLPDQYLARNTARGLDVEYVQVPQPLDGAPLNAGVEPGRPTVIGWHALCEVHEMFTTADIEDARRKYPDVVILAHPECSPDVIGKVDVAGSTKTMLDYVRDVDAPRYLLFTDSAMGDNLAAEFHQREMVRTRDARCKHMELITLEQTLAALQNNQYEVELPGDVIRRARLPIDRMLAIR